MTVEDDRYGPPPFSGERCCQGLIPAWIARALRGGGYFSPKTHGGVGDLAKILIAQAFALLFQCRIRAPGRYVRLIHFAGVHRQSARRRLASTGAVAIKEHAHATAS